MKKPGIPAPPKGDGERFGKAVKETLETMTGARGDKIAQLPSDAGIGDVIRTVNALLERLQ